MLREFIEYILLEKQHSATRKLLAEVIFCSAEKKAVIYRALARRDKDSVAQGLDLIKQHLMAWRVSITGSVSLRLKN